MVDLDRAQSTVVEAAGVENLYGMSVTYSVPVGQADWTMEDLDWYQLGLTICHIIDAQLHTKHRNDNHQRPVIELSTFWGNLVCKGL